MSMVNNGRISSNDQKIDDKKVWDDNFDKIKWKSKDARQQSKKESKNG